MDILTIILCVLIVILAFTDQTKPMRIRPSFGKKPFMSKGESHMKWCLESIYGKPFNKVRPSWLVNPKTGRRLELDCYNEELNIAGEYNGIQHYKYTPPIFHKTEEDFEEQKYRDKIKRGICRIHNVKLITVPYTVKEKHMLGFIKDRIRKMNSVDT